MTEFKDNIKSGNTWRRLFFVALYLAILCVLVDAVFVALVIIQCGFLLLTGEKNTKLLQFTDSVVLYYIQVLNYLCFRDDTLPFPFGDFPKKA